MAPIVPISSGFSRTSFVQCRVVICGSDAFVSTAFSVQRIKLPALDYAHDRLTLAELDRCAGAASA
jgi:hypothetical protein